MDQQPYALPLMQQIVRPAIFIMNDGQRIWVRTVDDLGLVPPGKTCEYLGWNTEFYVHVYKELPHGR